MTATQSLLQTVDKPLLEEVASRLDLRDPNVRAVESLAVELKQHLDTDPGEPFECVIDAATGVGKTYVLAGAVEYFAARGISNFAVITPGRTILDKTVANFTKGHRKSLLGGMEVEPVLITSENFNTPAMRAAMDDPSRIKLYVFTVQSLTKPTTKTGRKTHKFQEGLGQAFYEHLDNLDDLIVFADEHHCYYGDAFSDAVRGLTPLAVVGLTATPHAKTPEEEIIFRYPLAAAIADKLVKIPVVVGRKDDRKDAETKLLDGVRLLEAKRKTIERYCAETGAEPINPVMLVICPSIDVADEVSQVIEDKTFLDGRYVGTVLTVHSKKPDEELAKLDAVEDADSAVRIIISVGMLKEGWDVKNVYVILSFRPSISDILTEQTLGRGLRLPFGTYTNWELLDTLEVLAHERYEDLLKKSKVINQEFIDHRTRAVVRRDAEGNEVTVLEETPVSAGDVALTSVEDRQKEAEEQAEAKQLLPNVGKFDVLYLPDLRMSRVESKFSFADITDLSPFKDLGQRLADDPEQELRRTRLDAIIIEGADGMRHTELVTGKTIDRIEAPSTLIPMVQAKKDLADRVLASNVGGARRGARAQLQPIIDMLIEAMGAKAEEILSGYGDRTASRLIQLIGDEQRLHAPKPHYTRVVELREFVPVRSGRPETSLDRTGAFKKVGYEGWAKCYYEQVWFDSSTERDTALILDDADEITYWVRLHINDLPIIWEDGTYNPDFIAVAKDGTHWVVEVKSDRDMKTDEVKAKREAAKRWANYVSADSKVKTKWRYLLVSESDVAAAKGDWTALKSLSG